MIDLHCHALPGVDDGPPDMDAALALLRAQQERGVHTVVATSHIDHGFGLDSRRRDAALADVRAALAQTDIDVELLPGAEIAIDRFVDLDDEERDALRLGGGPYWLLESPLSVAAGPFDQYVGTLLGNGAKVLLAHPERCPTFLRDPDKLARLVYGGALTSVTAGAFAGRFGAPVREFAFAMLRDGLVHSVASDAHNVDTRPPGLRDELDAAGLGALVPWLTEQVPAAILAGDRLPPSPPLPETATAPRRGALRRFFGG